ncbi:MAG: beta-propeller fold lactonase family protein [Bryobacteraceae bacterium]|nr:beta-propeller fold lactonase family protein [Bryobacteraceae bacterium]
MKTIGNWLCLAFLFVAVAATQVPGPGPAGYLLPNGWRLTPLGKSVPTEDLLLKMLPLPGDKGVVAVHSGYNRHGISAIGGPGLLQMVDLGSTWAGLAWDKEGSRLFVSGGGCCRQPSKGVSPAPVWVLAYKDGRFTEKPTGIWKHPTRKSEEIYWGGLAFDAKRKRLYAVNRYAREIVIFESENGAFLKSWKTDDQPMQLSLDPNRDLLYCSNPGSDTIGVYDLATEKLVRAVSGCDNPGEFALHPDGRVFVTCSNENTVISMDPKSGSILERIETSLYPNSPEGSTPNSLLLNDKGTILIVANADNNNLAVIDVSQRESSKVRGFLPTGWYPTSLAWSARETQLFVGNSKGVSSAATPYGIGIPAARERRSTAANPLKGSVHTLTKGAVSIVDFPLALKALPEYTKQAYANAPYHVRQLAKADKRTNDPSVVPTAVGVGSPIEHVIYIIKENRTYDQVLGDIPKGNGDPELTLFGRDVTPNQHKIAEEFVLLDNLYCDGEVSSDGHQWSTAAYANEMVEKSWPSSYSRRGSEELADQSRASLPRSGYIWDSVLAKGLTLRMYGDDCCFVGGTPDRIRKHFAAGYGSWKARDYENAKFFLDELANFEKNYESTDAAKRLPNFSLMMLPEDHTYGASPGKPVPTACVASNDLAVGRIVEGLTKSRYWPKTAIFIIEDDAQEGSDHVDARRTTGYVISPYVKRGSVDSTLYTTSSFLRTMELLLGLPPMSQFDASATPLFRTFSAQPDLRPFAHVPPEVDVDAFNKADAPGAKASLRMDFSQVDRTPMYELNQIVWKSVRGAHSEMPAPRSRFLHAGK